MRSRNQWHVFIYPTQQHSAAGAHARQCRTAHRRRSSAPLHKPLCHAIPFAAVRWLALNQHPNTYPCWCSSRSISRRLVGRAGAQRNSRAHSGGACWGLADARAIPGAVAAQAGTRSRTRDARLSSADRRPPPFAPVGARHMHGTVQRSRRAQTCARAAAGALRRCPARGRPPGARRRRARRACAGSRARCPRGRCRCARASGTCPPSAPGPRSR